jgi:KAP family P-loop domain
MKIYCVIGEPGTGKIAKVKEFFKNEDMEILRMDVLFDDTLFEENVEINAENKVVVLDEFDRCDPKIRNKIYEAVFENKYNAKSYVFVIQDENSIDGALLRKMIII